MRFINTSGKPDSEVRAVIRFALGNVARYRWGYLKVHQTSYTGGAKGQHARTRGNGRDMPVDMEVGIHTSGYPFEYKWAAFARHVIVNDWQEDVCFLVGHEAYHARLRHRGIDYGDDREELAADDAGIRRLWAFRVWRWWTESIE